MTGIHWVQGSLLKTGSEKEKSTISATHGVNQQGASTDQVYGGAQTVSVGATESSAGVEIHSNTDKALSTPSGYLSSVNELSITQIPSRDRACSLIRLSASSSDSTMMCSNSESSTDTDDQSMGPHGPRFSVCESSHSSISRFSF